MKCKITLITAAMLNFILALVSFIFFGLFLTILITNKTWNVPFYFIVATGFFWLFSSTVLLSQSLYLRLWVKSNTRSKKAGLMLLIGNIILVVVVGGYGLKALNLEYSFIQTFWHFKILEIMTIIALLLSLPLINIKIILGPSKRKEELRQ